MLAHLARRPTGLVNVLSWAATGKHAPMYADRTSGPPTWPVLLYLAARAVHWLRRPQITRRLEQVSAAVLAAFGIGTLASARQ